MWWDGLIRRRRDVDDTARQTEPEPAAPPAPPKIGLALGGGSARGWAHIGVLAEMDDAGIRPDIVAGCSIGAVVGGCFAAGKLDELTVFALSLTRRSVLGLLDIRLIGSGLIAGDRLRLRLLRELAETRVERLPVRFGSVATELGSGDEAWLTSGPLIDAIRASYAIPGIFPPVAMDGRFLMDGTLVNPVPVTLARDLGADIVIGVNLNGEVRSGPDVIRPSCDSVETAAALIATDAEIEPVDRRDHSGWAILHGVRRLRLNGSGARARVTAPGLASVVFDAFNITQDRIWRARLATDPPDLSITPRLDGMGLFEFHRAAEGIALGREAARAALPRLHQLIEAKTGATNTVSG